MSTQNLDEKKECTSGTTATTCSAGENEAKLKEAQKEEKAASCQTTASAAEASKKEKGGCCG